MSSSPGRRLPTSRAAIAAREIAERYCSPSLLNHSLRSYVWACERADVAGIDFDGELLFVAAMLHDVALTPEFDNHRLAFEEASGHIGWVVGAAAGWPVQRRDRVADVIVRHMRDDVDALEDPEGHLLQFSTAMDISGRDLGGISARRRKEILGRIPRLALVEEFTVAMRDQAGRKHGCAAAAFIAGGGASRISSNPLDSNP